MNWEITFMKYGYMPYLLGMGNTDHSLHYLKSLATRLHRKNCIGEKGELKVFVDDKLKAHKHIPFDDKWATV